MTFAPPTILAARAYLKGQDADLSDAELGITGGPSHVVEGTSYHLGRDQLKMSRNPYSARTQRDRNGLSNAASALDVDDDLDELRALSLWVVQQCRLGASDTLDVREVIFSPDGVNVYRWDRERGQASEPVPDDDLSHRSHTHFSYYRDSEFRDKVGLFRRFFEGTAMSTLGEYNSQYMIQNGVVGLEEPVLHIPAGEGHGATSLTNPLASVLKAIVTGTNATIPAFLGVPARTWNNETARLLTEINTKLDLLLKMPPGSVDPEVIRTVVREELNATKLGPAA